MMDGLSFNVREYGKYVSFNMKHDNYKCESFLHREEVIELAEYLEKTAHELFECVEVTDD